MQLELGAFSVTLLFNWPNRVEKSNNCVDFGTKLSRIMQTAVAYNRVKQRCKKP
jgi:hypothetical protein